MFQKPSPDIALSESDVAAPAHDVGPWSDHLSMWKGFFWGNILVKELFRNGANQ